MVNALKLRAKRYTASLQLGLDGCYRRVMIMLRKSQMPGACAIFNRRTAPCHLADFIVHSLHCAPPIVLHGEELGKNFPAKRPAIGNGSFMAGTSQNREA